MQESKNIENIPHELVMRDRKSMRMNGVCEVISFDDNSVVLKTVKGELAVEGAGLKVSALDTNKGEIMLDGNIQSVVYYDTNGDTRKGFFGRFR